MNVCYGSWKMCVFLAVLFFTKDIQAEVQPITGGTFNPSLVPTIDPDETTNDNISDRVIVDDATLTGIEINGILYTDVEGPTNATVVGGGALWPLNGTSPGSSAAAIINLSLSFASEVKTANVYFASEVNTSTDGGFFFSEWSSSDDIYVYPLGSDGEPIGSWQLYLDNNDYGSDKLLAPHGKMLYANNGSPYTQSPVGGAAFTLADFTGGDGVLNNVKGLRLVDPGSACDPVMIGIYRGPGESVLYRAGRAFKMRDATFNVPVTNHMSGDFTLTGFCGTKSISGPANAYQFDTRTESNVIWPADGIKPTITNSLLGLDINGVQNLEYWDFMFAEPVTNVADGFFILDENDNRETTLVFPLDADRRPISTYSVAVLQTPYQWSTLAGNMLVEWGGNLDNTDPSARIAGTVIPLGAFCGGNGPLTTVHGIRVCAHILKWDGNRKLDPLVVGSYKAEPIPRPIYDAELDPMPSLPPDTDHVGYIGYFRDDWSLTGIILESGRYTDLEGPAKVNLASGQNWEYAIDSTNPPASAAESALGLDSSGLMNCHNSYWYFDTTITNGFNGGFFLFDADRNHTKVEPLGVNSNVIAGFSMLIIQNRDFTEDLESAFGGTANRWRRLWGNPPVNEQPRYLRGVSFTLDCFTNAAGESLTSDVIGVRLTNGTYDGNTHTIDTMMVGIYKGPADPPVSGISLPITGVTFSPPLSGPASYSNDTNVAGIQSSESESWSVKGPDSDDVYGFTVGGSVYYPIYGTNPGTFTNALAGLNVDGVIQTGEWTEYMFDEPVRQSYDGFFIMEHGGQDLLLVRPLDANRIPISTYSVRVDNVMFARMGLTTSWILTGSTTSLPLYGTMIRLSDFAGGSGKLGNVYGIRIQEPQAQFDPAVVGQWFGPPAGTMILIQ